MTQNKKLQYIPWELIIIFIVLSLGIGIAGYFFYDGQKKYIQENEANDLEAIATLKIKQITNWRKERLEDANVILNDYGFIKNIRQFQSNPKDTLLKKELLIWMESILHHQDYQSITILDTGGNVILEKGTPKFILEHHVKSNMAAVIKGRKVLFTDFHREEEDNAIHLSLFIPLFTSEASSSPCIGFVLVRIDPSRYLYPLIESWPTPSPSGESNLVRREGSSVLYLNELRQRKNTALVLATDTTITKRPSVLAVLGKTGIIDGIDYRNIPVVASLHPVPDTPWFLVTKIDRDEIYAPIYNNARIVLIIVGLLILISGMVLGLIWRNQQSTFYQEQYENEVRHRLMEQHYTNLVKYANDSIILTDSYFQIKEVNDKAMVTYGYSKVEFALMNLKELRADPESSPTMSEIKQILEDKQGYVFEVWHRKKDRAEFPVEVSARKIDIDGNVFYQSIIRDITERKKAETRHNAFSELGHKLNLMSNPIEAAHIIVDIADRLFGWDACTFDLYDADENKIYSILNIDTMNGKKVNIEPTTPGSTPTSRMSRIIKSGAELILREKSTGRDDGSILFGDKNRRSESIMLVPIRYRGKVIGVLSLQSYTPHAYTADDLNTLQTFADYCGGALERIRVENELRENEQKYREIIEKGTNLFYSHTPDHILTYLSPQCKTLIDCEPEEAVHNWQSFLTDNPVNQKGIELTNRALETGIPSPPYELELMGKKGRKIWVEVHEAPVVREGKTVSMVGALVDITERKKTEIRNSVFSDLGHQLNLITNPQDASQIIVNMADRLFGWDACTFDLYDMQKNSVKTILSIDTIDGKRVNFPTSYIEKSVGSMSMRVIQQGAELINRENNTSIVRGLESFGDSDRLSMSLMFVPIRYGEKILGVMSLQSYTPHAYTQDDLNTLQSLADYCGGALQRIQSQEALTTSERSYHSLFENMLEGFALCKMLYENDIPVDFIYLDVNNAFETLTGLKNVIGKKVSEIIPGIQKSNSELINFYGKVAKTGHPGKLETYVQPLDIWFSISVYSTQKDYFVAVFDNITQRKKAEIRNTAFSELGHRLNLVTNPQDAAQIIVEMADKLFGWDASTFDLYDSGKNILIPVLSKDLVGGERVDVPSTYAYKPPGPRVTRIIEKGGELILRENETDVINGLVPFGNESRMSLSLMFVPIRYGNKVLGIMSLQSYTFHSYTPDDLTTLQSLADYCGSALERLNTQSTLRESEEKYRLLVENVSDGIIINQDGKFIYFNQQFEDMLGYAHDELLGKDYHDIFTPEGLELIRQRTEDSQAGKSIPSRYETSVVKKDGSVLHVETNITIIDYHGSLATFAVVRDITERKKLETQLLHAQKMEVVGTLAGGVAHDFNNLLTVINGYAEMLLSDEKLTSQIKEDLGQIFQASQRASELTKQLLLFSRKAQPEFQFYDLHIILNDSVKLAQRTLGPSIEIKMEKKAQDSHLLADPRQIQQIIMNLSVNARDAMHEGGTLTMKTENVIIDEEYCKAVVYSYPGYFLSLSVTDTGTGMDKETQKHIFEPFFTTKGIGKGTGLGLAVVYGIVKSHKGWINVYSEPGQGTTFRIYFPLAQKAESQRHAQVESIVSLPTGTETILLVDDDPSVLKFGKGILEKYGYQVIPVEKSKESIKIYQENRDRIALVITDMLMPELNGKEVMTQLRFINPSVKIILSSGADLSQFNSPEPKQVGMNGFVIKPYRIHNLLQTVRNVLDSKS